MAKEIKTQGTAEFDWDALALDGYTSTERSEMSDRYEGTLNSIAEREVIPGTVISLNKKEVVVNIGSKSEGVIASNEFRYNPDLAVGDTIDVYVETQEDKYGQLVVSHRIARVHSAWNKVNEVLVTGEIITGFVKCRTKGTIRKIKNLSGKEGETPQLNFSGMSNELVYAGGERQFIENMIKESELFSKNCLWFSTLVSKQSNLKWMYQTLERTRAIQVKTIPMGTGNKSSRIVAWSFLSSSEFKEWRERRWS